jgi:competence protein CoiA
LKEWHDSNALIFFDFQETKDINQSILWFLFPKIVTNEAYIWPIPRQVFIEWHKENKFDEVVKNTIFPIHKELVNYIQNRQNSIEYGHPSRIFRFERNMTNNRRRRRRF